MDLKIRCFGVFINYKNQILKNGSTEKEGVMSEALDVSPTLYNFKNYIEYKNGDIFQKRD